MATTNRRPLNFKNPFPQPAGVMFEGRLYQPTMLRIITAFYYILAWLSVIQKVVTGPTIVAWGHVLGMPVATAVFWYSYKHAHSHYQRSCYVLLVGNSLTSGIAIALMYGYNLYVATTLGIVLVVLAGLTLGLPGMLIVTAAQYITSFLTWMLDQLTFNGQHLFPRPESIPASVIRWDLYVAYSLLVATTIPLVAYYGLVVRNNERVAVELAKEERERRGAAEAEAAKEKQLRETAEAALVTANDRITELLRKYEPQQASYTDGGRWLR